MEGRKRGVVKSKVKNGNQTTTKKWKWRNKLEINGKPVFLQS